MNPLGKLQYALDTLARKVSFRRAVGISVVLHVFLAGAFASVFLSTHLVGPDFEDVIEFDLVTEDKIDRPNRELSGTPDILSNSTKSTSSMPRPAALSETTGGAEPKPSKNRDEVIFASLQSLSELRESFHFLEATLTTNLSSSLSPVAGEAPDVSGLTSGLSGGLGYGQAGGGVIIGIGGGGGDCPPRGN